MTTVILIFQAKHVSKLPTDTGLERDKGTMQRSDSKPGVLAGQQPALPPPSRKLLPRNAPQGHKGAFTWLPLCSQGSHFQGLLRGQPTNAAGISKCVLECKTMTTQDQ